MITKDSIEAAYCFFHQKYQVYAFSNCERQKDDIEYAISSYVEVMNPELYKKTCSRKRRFPADTFKVCGRHKRGYREAFLGVIVTSIFL